MSGTMTFLLGAGCLSGMIYWLTTRTENGSARRKRPAGDGYSSDYTSSSDSGGWNVASWFGSDNSGSNCSSDNSGSSSDSCSSGGDSGGGGDGGGGGD